MSSSVFTLCPDRANNPPPGTSSPQPAAAPKSMVTTAPAPATSSPWTKWLILIGVVAVGAIAIKGLMILNDGDPAKRLHHG